MMLTSAVAPAYRPVGVPVTSITTGKVVTSELSVPMRLIDPTVP